MIQCIPAARESILKLILRQGPSKYNEVCKVIMDRGQIACVILSEFKKKTSITSEITRKPLVNLSVIRQKGESQNEYYKKMKDAKFSKKGIFLTP